MISTGTVVSMRIASWPRASTAHMIAAAMMPNGLF